MWSEVLRNFCQLMEPLVFARAHTPPAPPVAGAVVPLPVTTFKTRRHDVAALFEAEESGLLRFAIGLVGQRAVAEELVQETFLRFHQLADEIENPRGWIYRSLRNLALNHLRDRPRESVLEEENTPPQEARLPAESLGRDEAVGLVRLLLAELSAEDRDLIQLKYLDELKYQEISRRTGLSVGNVGYRLHHLLKGLADSLRRAGIEGSQG
jgi:RNA polymerase sigma factor (sigma-70 family)